MNCNICGSNDIIELGNLGGIQPTSITSEPSLCSLPAKIYYCQNCDHLQKIYSQKESSFIEFMYSNYDAYNLSRGSEQLVFPEEGTPTPRSYYAIEKCLSDLPGSGNLLDIGTGNGVILNSASKLLPKWRLFAFDLSDKFKKDILTIPGVVDFYSDSIENVPKRSFNLIVLWHCLEHISEPVEFLSQLKNYLTEDGFLLIQVPDINRQPFDLAVIDHCSHFSKEALLKLCHSTGFVVAIDGHNWVHNCITLLLKPEDNVSLSKSSVTEIFSQKTLFHWINQTIDYFESATHNQNYAIFGTGISGIWVSSQLSNQPTFFIDEDRNRTGNQINNVPIILPQDLPPGMDIVMPFTQEKGRKIGIKIKKQYSACKSSNLILSPL